MTSVYVLEGANPLAKLILCVHAAETMCMHLLAAASAIHLCSLVSMFVAMAPLYICVIVFKVPPTMPTAKVYPGIQSDHILIFSVFVQKCQYLPNLITGYRYLWCVIFLLSFFRILA